MLVNKNNVRSKNKMRTSTWYSRSFKGIKWLTLDINKQLTQDFQSVEIEQLTPQSDPLLDAQLQLQL